MSENINRNDSNPKNVSLEIALDLFSALFYICGGVPFRI